MMERYGKSFSMLVGNQFLQHLNLGLMLNIDWFNPFKHTQCSVGVMYVSCSSDEYPKTKNN